MDILERSNKSWWRQ